MEDGKDEQLGDKQDEPKPEAKVIEMVIRLFPDGSRNISFPLLADDIFSYGFLKMGEKILDEHYKEMKKKLIETPRGSMVNFACGLSKKH